MDGQEFESRADAKKVGEAKFWQQQLDLSDKDCEEWIKQGRDVVQRYKSDPRAGQGKDSRKRFNILYSNTEVLKASLFARMAKPDVRRRFSDQDPTGRVVAELIQRALIYSDDVNDTAINVEMAVEDYVLPGRGVMRVQYKPTMAEADGKEYVAKQEVWDEYVPWEDYRHEPVRVWDKITWEAYRHLMTLDDLQENFGDHLPPEEIKRIPLNWQPEGQDKKAKIPEGFKKAEVWEVWDKFSRKRVWVVKGYDKLCRQDKDPYGLEHFFPRPDPIQATTTTDTVIPQPLYNSYKDQAEALDEIETRIDRLTKALRRRGPYNAAMPELKKLANLGDNQFIPVEKWNEFQTGGGLKGNYEVEDLQPVSLVLAELHKQRDLRIQTIYEIIGIADIMRGNTDPNETLGAQQLKAQFGGNRLKKRQDAVQKFIRDLLRIKAEIIAEHFEPEQLSEMTGFPWQPVPPEQPVAQVQPPSQPAQGVPSSLAGLGGAPGQPPSPEMGGVPSAGPMGMPQGIPMGGGGMPNEQGTGQAEPAQAPDRRAITPEIMEILRTDRLRSYRIDVETDSTIYEDAEQERQTRVELITAMTQFIGNWAPIIQAQPELMPLAFEMLAFGVRGFKAGSQLEEALEQTRMELEQAAQNPQPQGPSPEELAMQAEQQKAQMQAEAAKHATEIKAQTDMNAAQIKQQTDAQALAAKQAAEQHAAELKAASDAHKAELEMAKKNAELEQKDRHHQEEMALKREQMEMEHEFKRETAEREHNMRKADHKLKSAAQNKQIVEEADQDVETDGDMVKTPFEVVGEKIDDAMEGMMMLMQQQMEQNKVLAEGIKVIAEGQQKALEQASKPKKFNTIRDPQTGRLVGGEEIRH
jgi:ribosomal protein L35